MRGWRDQCVEDWKKSRVVSRVPDFLRLFFRRHLVASSSRPSFVGLFWGADKAKKKKRSRRRVDPVLKDAPTLDGPYWKIQRRSIPPTMNVEEHQQQQQEQLPPPPLPPPSPLVVIEERQDSPVLVRKKKKKRQVIDDDLGEDLLDGRYWVPDNNSSRVLRHLVLQKKRSRSPVHSPAWKKSRQGKENESDSDDLEIVEHEDEEEEELDEQLEMSIFTVGSQIETQDEHQHQSKQMRLDSLIQRTESSVLSESEYARFAVLYQEDKQSFWSDVFKSCRSTEMCWKLFFRLQFVSTFEPSSSVPGRLDCQMSAPLADWVSFEMLLDCRQECDQIELMRRAVRLANIWGYVPRRIVERMRPASFGRFQIPKRFLMCNDFSPASFPNLSMTSRNPTKLWLNLLILYVRNNPGQFDSSLLDDWGSLSVNTCVAVIVFALVPDQVMNQPSWWRMLGTLSLVGLCLLARCFMSNHLDLDLLNISLVNAVKSIMVGSEAHFTEVLFWLRYTYEYPHYRGPRKSLNNVFLGICEALLAKHSHTVDVLNFAHSVVSNPLFSTDFNLFLKWFPSISHVVASVSSPAPPDVYNAVTQFSCFLIQSELYPERHFSEKLFADMLLWKWPTHAQALLVQVVSCGLRRVHGAVRTKAHFTVFGMALNSCTPPQLTQVCENLYATRVFDVIHFLKDIGDIEHVTEMFRVFAASPHNHSQEKLLLLARVLHAVGFRIYEHVIGNVAQRFPSCGLVEALGVLKQNVSQETALPVFQALVQLSHRFPNDEWILQNIQSYVWRVLYQFHRGSKQETDAYFSVLRAALVKMPVVATFPRIFGPIFCSSARKSDELKMYGAVLTCIDVLFYVSKTMSAKQSSALLPLSVPSLVDSLLHMLQHSRQHHLVGLKMRMKALKLYPLLDDAQKKRFIQMLLSSAPFHHTCQSNVHVFDGFHEMTLASNSKDDLDYSKCLSNFKKQFESVTGQKGDSMK